MLADEIAEYVNETLDDIKRLSMTLTSMTENDKQNNV